MGRRERTTRQVLVFGGDGVFVHVYVYVSEQESRRERGPRIFGVLEREVERLSEVVGRTQEEFSGRAEGRGDGRQRRGGGGDGLHLFQERGIEKKKKKVASFFFLSRFTSLPLSLSFFSASRRGGLTAESNADAYQIDLYLSPLHALKKNIMFYDLALPALGTDSNAASAVDAASINDAASRSLDRLLTAASLGYGVVAIEREAYGRLNAAEEAG